VYYTEIHYAWLGLLLGIVACIVTSAVYPLALRMARVWGVLDNPDERKLQRHPVPTLGGLAIFVGLFVTTALFLTCFPITKYAIVLVAMIVLLFVGVWDDKKQLPIRIRVLVEMTVVIGMIYYGKALVDHLGGIWGIDELNDWVAWIISVVAGIGVINAFNLIDGVDGYSSAYAMCVCMAFAAIFYFCNVYSMGILGLIGAGSVFPFFLHNVFGKKTKMFIGDGGTLMIGALIVGMMFSMLRKGSLCNEILHLQYGVGGIPLCLSVLSIAVFDTLRVAFSRMVHGKSPFHPDKSHLHHLFIDYGFSHIGTTCCILMLNGAVVVAWMLCWLLGADVTTQLYVVVFVATLATFVFYPFMRHQSKKRTKLFHAMTRWGGYSHIDHTRFWLWMQKFVDDELFSDGKNPERTMGENENGCKS